MNKPTVNFRKEPGFGINELLAEARQVLLVSARTDPQGIEKAKEVDAAIGKIDWTGGIQLMQKYCIVNVVEIQSPATNPRQK